MKTARDLLEPAVTIGTDAPVRDLADLLLREKADGACVVEGSKLVGIVTTMDLVFKEKKVHLPTMLYILDAVIPLGPMRDVEDEFEKMAASTVGDLMTADVRTVGPATAMDEIATLMVEKHVTVVPVVEEGNLLGVVTKRGLLLGSGLASAKA